MFDPLGRDKNPDRYRHYLDPVSIFDRSAERYAPRMDWTPVVGALGTGLKSHGYDIIGDTKTTSQDIPEQTVNQDTSINLVG